GVGRAVDVDLFLIRYREADGSMQVIDANLRCDLDGRTCPRGSRRTDRRLPDPLLQLAQRCARLRHPRQRLVEQRPALRSFDRAPEVGDARRGILDEIVRLAPDQRSRGRRVEQRLLQVYAVTAHPSLPPLATTPCKNPARRTARRDQRAAAVLSA